MFFAGKFCERCWSLPLYNNGFIKIIQISTDAGTFITVLKGSYVMKIKEPIFLEPYLTHNVWGGDRLIKDFGYKNIGKDIGECWGISGHVPGESVVKNTEFKGMKLSELYDKRRDLFGNVKYKEFPLLVKIIDARKDLSIQVHPDNEYAGEHENGSYGKTECWYILDAPKDATLVIGHNASTRVELTEMVRGKRWNDLIREIPVKKGDFIQIDPGTVHAIKAGILLLETQQSCDITYRLYDYDRLYNGKLRELHINKALDVINVPGHSTDKVCTDDMPENKMNKIYECEFYKIYKMIVNRESDLIENKHPFLNVSVVSGTGEIDGNKIKKGDHFILPYGYGDFKISGNLELIASSVK
jgi:beta-glucosidase